MKTNNELQVWHKGLELILSIYSVTAKFPEDKLMSQMRRSALSIAANIAEGLNRREEFDWVCYLQIALWSMTELEYHSLLAHELSFLSVLEYDLITQCNNEVQCMMHSCFSELCAYA